MSIQIPPADVAAALRALMAELYDMPHHDQKSAFVNVQRERPELVDDSHLMRFLRVEQDFNVSVSIV